MHDAEVTGPMKPRRRRKKRSFDVAPYRTLFRALAFLRAASPAALDAFFFRRAFPGQSGRNSKRMAKELVDEGYLSTMSLPYARRIYHLTRRSFAVLEDEGIGLPETFRRPPTVEIGGYLWLQSSLRAALVRDGFRVGRGPADVHALRSYLMFFDRDLDPRVERAIRDDAALRAPHLDACRRCDQLWPMGTRCRVCPSCKVQTKKRYPVAAFRCPTCGALAAKPGSHVGRTGTCEGVMREVECVPVDVAWREHPGGYDVRLLFVDHPSRSLAAQLEELPLTHLGAPKVPIILRSTDPDSRYDRRACAWVVKGPRHQQLERAFTSDGFGPTFSLPDTTTLIDVRPDLQLHIMRSGAPVPAWECAGRPRANSKNAARAKPSTLREENQRHGLLARDEAARILRVEEMRERLRPPPGPSERLRGPAPARSADDLIPRRRP